MSKLLVLVLFSLGSVPALAAEPIRVVDETLPVPANVDPRAALESVVDIARIFELYQPVIPWIPGVNIDLRKEVLSPVAPCVLELPVSGNAMGRAIDERARVTATTVATSCGKGANLDGRRITLDFHDSTHNIERRIDRIEITACLGTAADGQPVVHAAGRMYAGYQPVDPTLNPINEAIGARALEGAFIRQVSAVLVAVQTHWTELPHTAR